MAEWTRQGLVKMNSSHMFRVCQAMSAHCPECTYLLSSFSVKVLLLSPCLPPPDAGKLE